MLLIIILYALIALTFPIAKLSTTYANPLFIVCVRMIIASLGLMAYTHCFGSKKSLSNNTSDVLLFFKAALFHIYLAFVPEFWALQYLSALKVNIIYCITPFVSALLEAILLKKKITMRQLLGICIGSSGVIFLALSTEQHCSAISCTYPFLPEILLTVSVISAAYAWFIIKQLMHRGYSLAQINGTSMLIGGLLSALSLPFFSYPQNLVINPTGFMYTVLALIIISNVIIYNLYGTLLKKYRPTFLSLAGFLSPLFGMLYAYFLFNEQLTWHYGVACVLVGFGILLFYEKN